MSDDKLGPLPDAATKGTFPGPHGYSCEQMRAYAAEQVAAALAQLTQDKLVKFGCHCDLEAYEGQQPDGCVLDIGRADDCVYAQRLLREGKGRDDCKEWRQITVVSSNQVNSK